MRGSCRTAVVVILPLLLGRVLATPQTPQVDDKLASVGGETDALFATVSS